MVHEINHLLRDHCPRAENIGAVQDPALAMLWNCSADCSVNSNLKEENIVLPTWRDKSGKPIGTCVLPSTYGLPDGLMAEEYYHLLRDMTDIEYVDITIDSNGQITTVSRSDGKGSKSKDDSGSSPSSSSDKPSSSSQPNQVPPPGATDSGGRRKIVIYRVNGQALPGAGRCGSAASGQQESWELGPPDGSEAKSGLSKSESEMLKREVARMIQESSKNRGSVPAGWKRWADEQLVTKVDWRKELRSLIRGSLAETMGAVDYSRKRMSRRQSAYGDIIMPALRRPMPNISVVIDTSGSMGDKKVCQCIAEVAGVLKEMGAGGVTIFSVDAAVHEAKKCFSAKNIELFGGGGTDMRIGITAALEKKPKPDSIIVLTDGETPWPESPPNGVDLIIGLIGTGQTPSWAKTVKIED